jgi:hypothetical protein
MLPMSHLARLGLMVAGLLGWAVSASAQPVQYEELLGFKIETSMAAVLTSRVDGQVVVSRVLYRNTLEVRADGALKYEFTSGFRIHDEPYKTRAWSGSATLGKPFPFRDGQAVWIFENESFMRLRTLDEGGAQTIFKITRSDTGFTCQHEVRYATEVGVGKLAIAGKSTASGKRLEVISEKPTSTSCRISKL